MTTPIVRLLAAGALAALAACQTAGAPRAPLPADYAAAGCDFAVTFPAPPRQTDVTFGAAEAVMVTGGAARLLYAACLPLADPSEREAAGVLRAVVDAEDLGDVTATTVTTDAGPGYALIGRSVRDGRAFTQQYVLTPGPRSSLLVGAAADSAAWPTADTEPFFRSIRRR